MYCLLFVPFVLTATISEVADDARLVLSSQSRPENFDISDIMRACVHFYGKYFKPKVCMDIPYP